MSCSSPHGALESREKVWGQAGDGTTKGDPEAGARATVLARGEEDLLPLA